MVTFQSRYDAYLEFNTVEPDYYTHSWDTAKVALIERCPYYQSHLVPRETLPGTSEVAVRFHRILYWNNSE